MISTYDRFIDASSGCSKGFIDGIYLHEKLMGQAPSNGLTDWRSLKLKMSSLVFPADWLIASFFHM